MINCLMVVPNRQDATSLYRSMGPFSDMRKTQDFNMIFTGEVDWSILNMVDMVFIQRAYSPAHRHLAELCKLWNVPLWVDYDDLLLDIPVDNPAHGLYMNQTTREDMIRIAELATCITVSTKQLKRCLQIQQRCLNEKVFVVPNALMDRLLIRQRPRSTHNLVSWRGTNTHQKDLATYSVPMIEFAYQHPDVTFNFIGYNPWMITPEMPGKQAMVTPGMSIGEYFQYMSQINPYLNIVPLHHSLFNKCKSNIAWLEAALVGAVSVAPDWEEWQKPGVLTYSDHDSFKSCMEFAFSNPQVMAEYHAQSMDYIRDNLMLSKVNDTRLQILNALYSISRGHDDLESADFPPGGARLTDRDKKDLECLNSELP